MLESSLAINKSLTIEGNGVVLTRAATWTAGTASQLVTISGGNTVVTISRVHFKDAKSTRYGAAIYNTSTGTASLTLESCIFSGNANSATSSSYHGGAISSSGTLTIRGCTFYGNSTGLQGGAVYFSGGSGTTLTLTGNLFYGNTAGSETNDYPVVRKSNSASTLTASYNVVDAAFGTGTGQCGWTEETGNFYSMAPLISTDDFNVFYGGEALNKLPGTLPDGYPAKDFYDNEITGGGAAGAVQTVTDSGKYYLELTVNKSGYGEAGSNPTPDDNKMVSSGAITYTATPTDVAADDSAVEGYSFEYWLINGLKITDNPYSTTIDSPVKVQAVFSRRLKVSKFTDASEAGTLRYALTQAEAGETIRFSGVTAGETEIELTSALPTIAKNLTIEGNGVVLTRASSWTIINNSSQLLYINKADAVVNISGVHFKDGQASANCAAIYNIGTLTLKSCIFSGNRTTTGNSVTYGGAVYSTNTLTVQGCTFYGNHNGCTANTGSSASSGGGAVHFSAAGKTLTLTGNLFYGNTTGLSYPVVRVLSGTATASYNVVDVAFGTGASQAGWEEPAMLHPHRPV